MITRFIKTSVDYKYFCTRVLSTELTASFWLQSQLAHSIQNTLSL